MYGDTPALAMAGGRAQLERAPLLGGDEIVRDASDVEQGLASTSGSDAAGPVREGVRFLGRDETRWGDASERQRRSRTHRTRLGAVGTVAFTFLLALASNVDVRTSNTSAALGDFTDGGAWGFGLDGTVGVHSGIVSSARPFQDMDDVSTHEKKITHPYGADAPEWVRAVAPFETKRQEAVIDWLADDDEWPLFGSEADVRLDNLNKRTARVERNAKVNVHATSASSTPAAVDVADTAAQRRAERVAQRIKERTGSTATTAHKAVSGPLGTTSPVHTQPQRDQRWRNPAGEQTTFSVNVCGVPPEMRKRQAPWPACRVLLVGCPGGRSAPDANVNAPACANWDVSRALEMQPEHGAGHMGSFLVTTNLYGPGDEFAFALVKPGCTDVQIAELLRRQGSGVDSAANPENFNQGVFLGECEIRLDSGFPMGNQLERPGVRDARCWSQTSDGAPTTTASGESFASVLGDALCESTMNVKRKGKSAVGALGEDNLSPFAIQGDTCLLRRDKSYKPKAFHRVVPERAAANKLSKSNSGGFGDAVVDLEGAIASLEDSHKIEFVWGTCDSTPRKDVWCASPAFDTKKVASICGVAFEETKDAHAKSKKPKRKKPSASELGEDKKVDEGSDEDAVGTLLELTPADRAASAAAALRSKIEPLLSDSVALAAESAAAATEADSVANAASVQSVKALNTGTASHDLFGTASDVTGASQFLLPGQWAETESVVLDLDGAPHAVAHVLLRDGDARFATEHLPWAEMLVNGEVVRPPRQLAKGDVVKLRVRAETEREIEARTQAFGVSNDPVRVATLVVGERSGTVRARVQNRNDVGGKVENERSEAVEALDVPRVGNTGAVGAAHTSDSPEEHIIKSHMTLDNAAPGTTAHLLSAIAPRSGQWMVLPPVDKPAVTIAGLGENAKRAVTIRFAEEDAVDGIAVQGARDSNNDSDELGLNAQQSIDSVKSDDGSDRRVSPGGEVNGVFAKINGRDESRNEKSESISVWTREETMQVARVDSVGKGTVADPITVSDRDKLRVKIRAPAVGSPAVRLAVFVGEKRVGTAVVATAANEQEAKTAGDALDLTLRNARNEAIELEHKDHALMGSSEGSITGSTPTETTETTQAAPAFPPLTSLITGREITVQEMVQEPNGCTRVVAADSKVTLPTHGFMTIAGVLPSTELTLLVHAYEQVAGKDIEQRAVESATADDVVGSLGSLTQEEDDSERWKTAKLGATGAGGNDAKSTEKVTRGAGPIPHWVEVRVEGNVVTPPTPVWLARRISVKLKASVVSGVARRVVIRAGEQVWQATVVSESSNGALNDSIAPSSAPTPTSGPLTHGVTDTSPSEEVVASVNGLRDDVQDGRTQSLFVDGDQNQRLDVLEETNDAEDADEDQQDAKVETLEQEVDTLEQEVDTLEHEVEHALFDDTEVESDEEVAVDGDASDGDTTSSDDDNDDDAALASSEDTSDSPTRPSETNWIEGSDVDHLVHSILSDDVAVTIADSTTGTSEKISARERKVSTPRNHTVFSDANTIAIAPTPLKRDLPGIKNITLTEAGGIAPFKLVGVSNETLRDGGAGETVRGLGPGRKCKVTLVSVDERGVVSTPPEDDIPSWVQLMVNGNFVTEDEVSQYQADGDVLSVAVVAGDVTGDKRSVIVACVALADDDENAFATADDPAYVDDALANGEVVESGDLEPSQFASPGDAVLIFAATVISKPTPPPPPPPSPPPPFPPAAATLAFAKSHPRMGKQCDEAGVRRRERSKLLEFGRTQVLPNEYDASNAKPNLCGSTRPVCGSGAVSSGDAITQTIPDPSKDRDVLFVLDVSSVVTRDAFDEKLTELLLTLFCASHEGTMGQAGVVLYPAPRSTETCGSYEVAVPLARYSTQEWFDSIENLRNDPTACCGGAAGSSSTANAAPLAEALDGTLLEFNARGVHDANKRLAVVLSSGTPAPSIKDESCPETSDEKFSSMTRTFPFSKSSHDGGVVNACTYNWKYVPVAARRLELSGARVAAINIAGDVGSDGSNVVETLEAHAGSSLYGIAKTETVIDAQIERDFDDFKESWRGAAGAAHFVGAPWPGACDSDGHCALAATYGGEKGRWVYAAGVDEGGDSPSDSSGSETPSSASLGVAPLFASAPEIEKAKRIAAALGRASVGSSESARSAALGKAQQLQFRYDAGEPETCSFDLPLDKNGRNSLAIVSQPVSAHLTTIHEWGSAHEGFAKVNAQVAQLMCEPSTPHMCSLPEDDGPGSVVEQCRGATVPSDKTHDDTLACLRGVVNAACGRVELGLNYGSDSNSDSKCFPEGRLLHDADASAQGLVYGTLACNRVCVDQSEKKSLHARVEIDFQCAPGEVCAVGVTRKYAAGSEADTRRAEKTDEVDTLFPELNVDEIVQAATPPPPAFSSSQGYGIHGRKLKL